MIHKGRLRELLKEVSHLVNVNCHNEARLKVAVAFNLFNEARSLVMLDTIQRIEKQLPRPLERYQAAITERLIRHIRETHGGPISERIMQALKATK
jgi:hypothetical protein